MKKVSKGSVVIVEDDMLLSLVEGRIVNKLGYHVVAKSVSGEDAIQQIKAHDPDVVIMDISLKGELDGIDTMRRVRSFSDVPVIFLSGNSDKISIERAKKTDFIDFLVKPISLTDMVEPMKKALNQKRNKVVSHAS